jgi:hypothetical protein
MAGCQGHDMFERCTAIDNYLIVDKGREDYVSKYYFIRQCFVYCRCAINNKEMHGINRTHRRKRYLKSISVTSNRDKGNNNPYIYFTAVARPLNMDLLFN